MSGVPDAIRLARPQKSMLSVRAIDKQKERSVKTVKTVRKEVKYNERKFA